MELAQTAEIIGSNLCLSEFQAAVLLKQLDLLDEQNERRRVNAAVLDEAVSELGFRPQVSSPGTTARTYYEWAAWLEDDELAEIGAQRVAAAIGAELGGPEIDAAYPPANDNRLYRPHTRKRFAAHADSLDLTRHSLPVSEDAHRRVVTVHHAALLGDERDVYDIAAAFEKVHAHRNELIDL
jgi:L-glutamine:scyllo-inosose aminotransferase/L-glutamine:2-deoxy-scyllo-inosose/3-amino-2,3-dideoxy-scyllo-inosose aminotransferase